MDDEKKKILERAEKVLTEIRPHLWADEGDVRIIEVNDKMELVIQWMGACTKCELSDVTLKFGVKQAVMEQIHEITDVVVHN
jgi:Fe-S cluster biogenesis protein NfuA